MKHFNYILASAFLLSASQAFGWGQKGHDTVAAIAENHFTDATKAAISDLLDGKSVIYYANWLDNASHTPEYAYTKTWHYKNIDADKTYENAPLNKKGDIVTALDQQILVLQDSTKTKEDKALALKMVVHFLGDIHQPMHMGHLSDLGGNRWNVRWFKNGTNLHSVWDSRVPELTHKWSYTEWADNIDRATPEEAKAIVVGGTPSSWGKETYTICKEIYETTPMDSNLEYDYAAEWGPVVEQQFLRGGLRLADLLNSIFDTTYVPLNSAVKK